MPNKTLAYTFYRSLWFGLDIIFPPVCGGCGKNGSRWCSECHYRVNILDGALCDVCGLPQDKANICDTCRADRPHYSTLRAWAVYEGPIKQVLHKLKYRRDIALGDVLASEMAAFVKKLDWKIDTIVPIPLSPGRYKQRGYNQVGMIARPLAMLLDVEFSPKVLNRHKETRSQVGLSRQERKQNVHEAFLAGAGVKGKNILLLDDISTTGSTLSSAAEALYLCGAKEVFALTVARALPHHGLRHV